MRGAGAGASCDDASEDVSVAFSDHVARLDALDVAALLRRFAIHKKVRSPPPPLEPSVILTGLAPVMQNIAAMSEWSSVEPLRVVKWCVQCSLIFVSVLAALAHRRA